MSKIINVKIENILGLKNCEFSPEGHSVTIGGKNGQGKSSAISALIMALGGKSKVPAKPVREGETQGSVKIELEDLIVDLTVYDDRRTSLKVESKVHGQLKQANAVLSSLFGSLSFDPGDFKYMDSAKRLKTLMDLVGLDFSDSENLYKEIFEERTIVNRRLAQEEATQRPFDENLPETEVNIQELIAKVQERHKIDQRLNDIPQIILHDNREIAEAEKLIAELQGQISEHKKELEMLTREQKELQECTLESTEVLKKQLSEVEELNHKVRSNQKFKAQAEARDSLKRESEALTAQLEVIKAEKAERLKAAEFPLKGLSFDGSDITYNGIPYEQISESEQWEIATAIAFSLNPTGIVFMRKSGGLDADSREAVRKRAAERDVQLFMEVVDDSDDVQILIEDGTLKANRLSSHENTVATV